MSSTDSGWNPGNSQNSGGIKFGSGAYQIDQMISTEFQTEFKFCWNGSWNHLEGMNSQNSTEQNPLPLPQHKQCQTLLSHNHHHPQRPPSLTTRYCHQRPRGLSDAPYIPAGFRSFRWIPVPFQWNFPAKISPEQSPELTGTEWHWNPVTGMNTKNCQIW